MLGTTKVQTSSPLVSLELRAYQFSSLIESCRDTRAVGALHSSKPRNLLMSTIVKLLPFFTTTLLRDDDICILIYSTL
jgi:hypothetical protein